MIDVALLKKCQSGNEAAFNILMREIDPMLKAYCKKIAKNDDTAEELEQLTRIKVHKSICGFRCECNFSTWLYQIAKNTFYDYMRFQKRHLVLSLDEQPYYLDIMDESAHLFADDIVNEEYKRTVAEIVWSSIKKLAPDNIQTLVLFYMQDKSYDEISKILNIPVGTVKSRLFKAKKDLRKILKPQLEVMAIAV